MPFHHSKPLCTPEDFWIYVQETDRRQPFVAPSCHWRTCVLKMNCGRKAVNGTQKPTLLNAAQVPSLVPAVYLANKFWKLLPKYFANRSSRPRWPPPSLMAGSHLWCQEQTTAFMRSLDEFCFDKPLACRSRERCQNWNVSLNSSGDEAANSRQTPHSRRMWEGGRLFSCTLTSSQLLPNTPGTSTTFADCIVSQETKHLLGMWFTMRQPPYL